MTRIIAVTSGKGGVGKTNLSTNLALQLAAEGHRSCIFDADLGLANINILLGLYPEHTLEDVVLNGKDLADIIIRNYHGVDIIPGSSGVEKIANIDQQQTEKLIASFAALGTYDFLFLDTSAGVSRNIVSFCLAASEIVIVITPEPTALTDAYALLKILCLNGITSPVKIIVNQCKNTTVAKHTYSKFKDVVKKYLSIEIQPLGVMLQDPRVSEAVKRQQPFVNLFPNTIATKCIKVITKNLIEQQPDDQETYTIESFWRRCIQLFTGSLNLDGSKIAQPALPEPEPESTRAVLPAGDQDPKTPSAAAPEESAASPSETGPRTAEPAEAPQPSLSTDNGNLYPLLEKLIGSIGSISDEVSQLRKTFSENGAVKSQFTASGTAPPAAIIQPIKLDFVQFTKERGKE
ncbi:MAG: MinD/ParA family protein [Deltaproteobacteria bacterium]|nr:MinD/ParA family protein [Deltaproteobacteria bacterium]